MLPCRREHDFHKIVLLAVNVEIHSFPDRFLIHFWSFRAAFLYQKRKKCASTSKLMGKASKDAAKRLPRGSKERKRTLRGSRVAQKSAVPNPTSSQPPCITPRLLRYSNSLASQRTLSVIRRTLAACQIQARTPARAPEAVYLLPPPRLAAAIPPTRSVDCPPIACGLPMDLLEIAFGAILDAQKFPCQ